MKSFFYVRLKKGDNEYLYKYDLKGKLINKGTIATTEDIKTPLLSNSDIEKLWHVFDSKATSYKYFWFLSIIQLYKERGNTLIRHKNILAKMIANAWTYHFAKKGDFPKIDQIPKYIKSVKDTALLMENSDEKNVEARILNYFERLDIETILSPLLKNVPYRFLSPWIPFTSNEDVIAKSNRKDSTCLYSLHNNYITINPLWCNYLNNNYMKIESFIKKELALFLKCH